MRKKPDILLLLSVLVVSGVIISNFVVIGHTDKTTNLSLLNAQYSQFQTKTLESKKRMSSASNDAHRPTLSSQELVHIDSSKQQIR